MLTRRSLIGVICFAFVTLTACATVSGTGAWKTDAIFKASEFFPLHVGDKWVYRLPDGSAFTRSIAGVDEICEKTYMRMETSIGEKWWMISDETGTWLGKIQLSDGSTITFCPEEPVIDGIFSPGYSKKTRFDNAVFADAQGRATYKTEGSFSYQSMIMGASMFVGDTPKQCLVGSIKISYGDSGETAWNMESWSVAGLGQVKFTSSPDDGATVLESAIIDGEKYDFSSHDE